jgi:predicted methyltransferase
MYFRVLSVRPSFEGALETSEEDVSSVESLRIVLRVLIEYEGALETVLMLADRGPLDMRDLEAIPKERALEAIAELRRTGVIAIDKSTLWLTEQGNTIVEQLRRSLRKAGKTVAELA